jgi:tRNA G18 (ribose-2'-O)-methylase SpoU
MGHIFHSKMTKTGKEFFVIAHNIRSLYNVGSIFRTADAFGVSKIFLTGYTGTPANPVHKSKIGKAALGAEDWVAWEYFKSPQAVIRVLKRQKVGIVGLENNVGNAKLIGKFKPKFPLALLLGEEVGGINKSLLKLCDRVVEIPMLGKKESLNVSVAFGIAAFHVSASF